MSRAACLSGKSWWVYPCSSRLSFLLQVFSDGREIIGIWDRWSCRNLPFPFPGMEGPLFGAPLPPALPCRIWRHAKPGWSRRVLPDNFAFFLILCCSAGRAGLFPKVCRKRVRSSCFQGFPELVFVGVCRSIQKARRLTYFYNSNTIKI